MVQSILEIRNGRSFFHQGMDRWVQRGALGSAKTWYHGEFGSLSSPGFLDDRVTHWAVVLPVRVAHDRVPLGEEGRDDRGISLGGMVEFSPRRIFSRIQ
ncbi:hypothetical protein [Pasteuria penetrans]|uniref:hypothetical protein n=1 Tax=Pasteuria penetrans TaxID=86005 RepID=UPI0011F00B06|nr:hypothetical protein [Pasteuria penetrans]